jgi:hypothetical protein
MAAPRIYQIGREFFMEGDTITTYKLPKKVRLTIACVYLSSYGPVNDQGVIAKAKEELLKHNIELDVFPAITTKNESNTIPYSQYIKDTDEEYTALYKLAKEKVKQMGCTFVIPQPVVFGNKTCGGYGIAPRVTNQITPRLIMVSPTVNTDKMTLLHELGHAAGLHHDVTVGEPRNFMHEADGDILRTVMYQYQVEIMGKAMFSVG